MMLLAPIVKERKGEHVKTLENLAAQGFIRARIDGETCDLSDPPTLELHKKHTIEVVVDRFKVRDNLQQRLAESFETALELSGGIVGVGWMDEPEKEDIIFSANFACPYCGYSYKSWNRDCFHSTTQRALVTPVTAWAYSNISIQNA